MAIPAVHAESTQHESNPRRRTTGGRARQRGSAKGRSLQRKADSCVTSVALRRRAAGRCWDPAPGGSGRRPLSRLRTCLHSCPDARVALVVGLGTQGGRHPSRVGHRNRLCRHQLLARHDAAPARSQPRAAHGPRARSARRHTVPGHKPPWSTSTASRRMRPPHAGGDAGSLASQRAGGSPVLTMRPDRDRRQGSVA